MNSHRPSRSRFTDVRALRYHLREWGPADAPPERRLFMLHGWMDVSASFQFVVDALDRHWHVVAPDWRGFGLTERVHGDCYWFPDYVADLEFVIDAVQGDAPAHIVGHSMGGNVGGLYAGTRPERVRRFVNLEGFGMPATSPAQAPKRYARWMDELKQSHAWKDYADFAALADRLQKENPRLARVRAEFLARHWGREEGGKVVLRSDPAHKVVNATLYRLEEARACWAAVTAPVLWIEAADSDSPTRMRLSAEDLAERRGAFRNVAFRTLADAGHMLHHDQPEETAALVEAFLSA